MKVESDVPSKSQDNDVERRFVIEICVDSFESARIAQDCNADRIELCANLTEGGTTPSIGLFQEIKDKLGIFTMVMIRPRAGDFCYSEREIRIMEKDMHMFSQAGADGFVFGALTPEGAVDLAVTERLCESVIHPTLSTFHRAIDMTRDPNEAILDLTRTTLDRILTSGGYPTADHPDALELYRNYVPGPDGIKLVPASGVNAHNVVKILEALRSGDKEDSVQEIHFSASTFVPAKKVYQNDRGVSMTSLADNDQHIRQVDGTKIRAVLEAAANAGWYQPE